MNRGQYPGMTFEQLRLGLESGMESGASGLTHTWSTLSCNASNNTGEATRKAVLGLIIKPLVGVGDSLYAERSELSERKLVVVLRRRALLLALTDSRRRYSALKAVDGGRLAAVQRRGRKAVLGRKCVKRIYHLHLSPPLTSIFVAGTRRQSPARWRS